MTITFDERVRLHVLRDYPLEWSKYILKLAERDASGARRQADQLRVQLMDEDHPKKALLEATVNVITEIDYIVGANPDIPLGGPVRSSASFYRSRRGVL